MLGAGAAMTTLGVAGGSASLSELFLFLMHMYFYAPVHPSPLHQHPNTDSPKGRRTLSRHRCQYGQNHSGIIIVPSTLAASTLAFSALGTTTQLRHQAD